MPMCMSGAAVLKQGPSYFNRTESSSLIQSSLAEAFNAKQVVLSAVFNSIMNALTKKLPFSVGVLEINVYNINYISQLLLSVGCHSMLKIRCVLMPFVTLWPSLIAVC